MRVRSLAAVLTLVLALAACGGGGGAAVHDVAVGDAVQLIADQGGDAGFVVLDVRTPEEFAAGHLDGAVNLDVQDPTFRARAKALSTDTEYLVYCHSGNRSAAASAILHDLGFDDVDNVTGGGFADLVAAGAPVG